MQNVATVLHLRCRNRGGVLEPSLQKNDFSRFSAFRDSTVYACCGSYIVCYCTDFTIIFWHKCMHLDFFFFLLLMLTIRTYSSVHCFLYIVCYCTDFTIMFWHKCMHLDLFSLLLLQSVTFEWCATVAVRCNAPALILCVTRACVTVF